jgi:hypothetical protein
MIPAFFLHPARLFLIAELVLLCGAVPLLFTYLIPLRYLFPILWMLAIYGFWILRKAHGLTLATLWRREALNKANLKPILLRYLIAVAILSVCTAIVEPQKLFGFPLHRTGLWMIVMVFYPLVSVIPQELIFRPFFYKRYGALFHSPRLMLMASSAAFAFAHVLFQNWVAVLLCFAGGVLFSQSYERTRSLAVVWFEHAIYGCFIFTIGLGGYFYHGSIQAAQAITQ